MANEKFEQVMADPSTVKINETEFQVDPLQVKEFGKAQAKGQNSMAAGLIELVYHSLKKGQDITRDGVREAPVTVLTGVMDEIEELNGLEDFFDSDEKQEALKELQ